MVLEIPPKAIDPSPSSDIKIKDLLGRGGFGEVYQATYNDAEVAVKRLFLHVKPESKVELLKECQLIALLNHPNIIRLFGVCVTPDHWSLVLEIAKRGSLSSILYKKKTKLSWTRRLNIALDVARGMFHLDTKKVFHRDLKSMNILIKSDWTAVITDFGLSKLNEMASASSGSKTGLVGSIFWTAPELFSRKPFTSAADVYSFGMILYELLSYKTPFDDLSIAETVAGVLTGNRPKIPLEKECEWVKGCPDGYVEIMEKCWSQESSSRPGWGEIVGVLKKLRVEEKKAAKDTTTVKTGVDDDDEIDLSDLPRDVCQQLQRMQASSDPRFFEVLQRLLQTRPKKTGLGSK